MKRWLAVAATCFAIVPPALAGEAFQGRCVRVIDGNTVVVLNGDRELEVRLVGIEAPQLEQAFGPEAAQGASGLLLSRALIVEVEGADPFGRTVGRVRIGQLDASLEMVKAGLAWYSERSPEDGALAAAEAEARAARRGLWADANPTPPWVWRTQHPRDSHKALADLASKVHIKRDPEAPDGSNVVTVQPEQPATQERPTPAPR